MLGIPTTRGDRLFISLLGTRLHPLAWLGLASARDLWWASLLSPRLRRGGVPLGVSDGQRRRRDGARGTRAGIGRDVTNCCEEETTQMRSKTARRLLPGRQRAVALVLATGTAFADEAAAKKWIDTEFQPSTLSQG